MCRALACVPLLVIGLACGGVAPQKPTDQKKAEADPYPECRLVRDYLRANLPKPDEYEVIEWSAPAHNDYQGKRYHHIDVKYRYTNQANGKTVIHKRFSLTDDHSKIVMVGRLDSADKDP